MAITPDPNYFFKNPFQDPRLLYGEDFFSEARSHYDLEGLWADAAREKVA